jgi:hypothetical protein
MSSCIGRFVALAVALLGLTVSVSRPAGAGTYTFTGTVTSVSDPFGALRGGPAVVGAPVTGTFTYIYSSQIADYPYPINPYVSAYFYSRFRNPGLSLLSLTIGGAPERESPYSLTNIDIGHDVPPNTSVFPAGDLFRYVGEMNYYDKDTLVNYSVFNNTDYFPDPYADVVLNDPKATAFSSQALPSGPLPLSHFTHNNGSFFGIDANANTSEFLWLVNFRIDAIQSVAEPGGFGLLLLGTGLVGLRLMWRGGTRSPGRSRASPTPSAASVVARPSWRPP